MSFAFGSRRIYYNNFAEHLQNAYNPNMFYPGLANRWTDADWFRLVDMLAAFGFNVLEYWLVPRLFCRQALDSDFGREFARQMNAVADHAHRRGVKMEFICALSTIGDDWYTACPNDPADWREIQYLWEQWLRRLSGTDIVGIFPGDPGGCSRNGCTAETYIDKSCEIAALVKRILPGAEVEFNTWGPPFFGWGNIQCPPDWKGEFLGHCQYSAWTFDKPRADRAMRHLLRRLPDYPADTSVGINMGFDSEGNPDGDLDARPWAREIARTHAIQTWDFGVTEGENNVVPHWRFERLFRLRRAEREAAPYRGGICYTMTPKLNQLSLFMAAQSFLKPDADICDLAGGFLADTLGPGARALVPLLPLFEVVKDWGSYHKITLPRHEYHASMKRMAAILEGCAGQECDRYPIFPSAAAWREEMLFFARLFADLSAPAPDYAALRTRYWQRIYSIYDHLPTHVDPRPVYATDNLVNVFRTWKDAGMTPDDGSPVPGKWS